MNRGKPALRAALLLGLIVPAAAAAAPASRTLLAQASGFNLVTPVPRVEPLFYSVSLNGQALGETLLLRLGDGRLAARQDDWRAWHLKPPRQAAIEVEGESYWVLDGLPGFTAELDAHLQKASLRVAPQAFAESRFSGRVRPLSQPSRPDGLGGFLNYQAVGTNSRSDGFGDTTDVNGEVEADLFNRWGVATSEWVGLGLNRSEPDRGLPTRDIVRLDSAFRRDDPEAMTTLRIGDGAGKGGLWGRAVRFGGLQWSRNFSTQPDFITLPQLSLAGESALPSVLDLYVDGVRRQSLSAPPGPFVVENIPAVNGLGEVQLVVTDLLGRQQTLSAPYLSGPQQLRAGLHDYSCEAGVLRENFGRLSDDYGRFAATGLHRYGFTDAFTGEARLEARGGGGQTAGLGGVLAVPHLGVVSAAGAYSRESNRNGELGLLAWERTTRRSFSIGARAQFTSAGFSQTGSAVDIPPPSRLLAANAGMGLGHYSTAGVGYVNQKNRSGIADTEALTARVSMRLGTGSLSLLVFDRLQPDPDYTVALSYALPLAQLVHGTAGYKYRDGINGTWNSEAVARVERNTPSGEGLGYHVAVNQYDSDVQSSTTAAEAGAMLNAAHGSVGLEAAVRDDLSSYRGTLSGAIGGYHGHGFATRRITDGFAVVESGVAGIPLRVNSQPAATTDSHGVAVLPNLPAYQQNEVLIDLEDLPLDVQVRSPVVQAAPYYRSGVRLSLPVQRSRGALITLKLADGAPVPAGSRVTLAATGEEFPVGRDGLAFVSGLASGANAIRVSLREFSCAITVDLAADADPQPKLGPYVCAAPTP